MIGFRSLKISNLQTQKNGPFLEGAGHIRRKHDLASSMGTSENEWKRWGEKLSETKLHRKPRPSKTSGRCLFR